MLLEQPQKRKQIISITPLIDVVFILLLFFMLSSSFDRTRQIELRAGSSGSQASTVSETQMILMLSAEQAELNGVKYSLAGEAFVLMLQEMAGAEEVVFLAASPQVKIQQLILLVERIHRAGIHNLKLSRSVAP